jgi:hypothetical protein
MTAIDIADYIARLRQAEDLAKLPVAGASSSSTCTRL